MLKTKKKPTSPQKQLRDYKPFATSTEWLAVLLGVTLLLLALTEYACRSIPQHAGFGDGTNELLNDTGYASLNSRNYANVGVSREEDYIPNDLTDRTVGDSSTAVTKRSSNGAHLSPRITASITSPPASDGPDSTSARPSVVTEGVCTDVDCIGNVDSLLTPGNGAAKTSSSSEIVSVTTAIITQITAPISDTSIASTSRNPETSRDASYLSPTEKPETSTSDSGSYLSPAEASTSSDASYLSPTGKPETSTSGSGSYLSPAEASTSSDASYLSPTENPGTSTSDSGSYLSFAEQTLTPSDGTYLSPTQIKSENIVYISSVYVSAITSTYVTPITSSKGTQVQVTMVKTTRVETAGSSLTTITEISKIENSPTPSQKTMMTVLESTFTSVYLSTITPSPSQSILSKPIATSANSTGTYYFHRDGSVTAPEQITYHQYLIVSFLPLFLSIFYSIPWRIIECTARNMEPFYQLQYSGSDPLNLDYETPFTLMIPFKAILERHYMVLWASLISMVMLIVAPLSSQVLIVTRSNFCVDSGVSGVCNTWGIFPDLARMIEGFLGVIAILTILMMISGFKRESGVYHEPLSIIGLAALYRHSRALRSSQELENIVESFIPERKHVSVKELRMPVYAALPSNETIDATPVEGTSLLTPRREQAIENSTSTSSQLTDSRKTDTSIVKSTIRNAWREIKPRLLHIFTLSLLIGILTIVVVYYKTIANTGFNRFMNSQSFGVRFFMTILGTCTNLLWSRIDDDLRKMGPYYRLLQSRAKPQDSILLPIHTSPWTALIPSLRRKQYLISLISFCSILSEFLPITLANIIFSFTTSEDVMYSCFYLAMSILSLMILSLLILIIRPGNQTKRLPRRPCTIAAKLSYLAPGGETDNSNLLKSANGLALLKREMRDAKVIAGEKLYSMGIGEDGKLRIDEDERIVRKWGDENNDRPKSSV